VCDGDRPAAREEHAGFFSAMPSASMLLSSAGVTRTIPTREFLRPLSSSRINCLPSGTSFSLKQTVAPLDFRRSYNSEALPSRSSQAGTVRRSRRLTGRGFTVVAEVAGSEALLGAPARHLPDAARWVKAGACRRPNVEVWIERCQRLMRTDAPHDARCRQRLEPPQARPALNRPSGHLVGVRLADRRFGDLYTGPDLRKRNRLCRRGDLNPHVLNGH
jgi:hypothetical protein